MVVSVQDEQGGTQTQIAFPIKLSTKRAAHTVL